MDTLIKVKTYLHHYSLTAMEENGMEVGDNGREVEGAYGNNQHAWLLSCLTKRQRQVALLTMEGYTRKEVAEKLEISLQAIHQIVPRMRKRLAEKAQIRLRPRL